VHACVRVEYCFNKQAVGLSGRPGDLFKNLELQVFATITNFLSLHITKVGRVAQSV
jgi:hypothetical protein